MERIDVLSHDPIDRAKVGILIEMIFDVNRLSEISADFLRTVVEATRESKKAEEQAIGSMRATTTKRSAKSCFQELSGAAGGSM
jgi:TPP-dependent pyruvate/acetoin dehydrogenase alpha subunit